MAGGSTWRATTLHGVDSGDATIAVTIIIINTIITTLSLLHKALITVDITIELKRMSLAR